MKNFIQKTRNSERKGRIEDIKFINEKTMKRY